jgi:hypothetical protein
VDFHYNLKIKDNKLFSINLHKIDRIIDNRRDFLVFIKEELAYVPDAYKDFIDIFLKTAFDKLPPYRSYDYKITLESENILKYSLLYKISIKKLETFK